MIRQFYYLSREEKRACYNFSTLKAGGVLKRFGWLFSKENLWALLLFLIAVVLIIVTASMAPLWIYQGF